LSLGHWYSKDHKTLYLAARINHWYHQNVTAFEEKLISKGIEFDGQVDWNNIELSKTGQRIVDSKPNSLDQWKFMNDSFEREKIIKELHLKDGFEKVWLSEAFKLSSCCHVKKPFYGKSVSEEIKNRLKSYPDFIPDHVMIDGQRYETDHEIIKNLLENGHDDEIVEVRTVTGFTSPVRYFSPPNYPAFAVVAKKRIPKGTFVLSYGGELKFQFEIKIHHMFMI